MNVIPTRHDHLPLITERVLSLLQSSDEEKEHNEIKELNGKENFYNRSPIYTHCLKCQITSGN